LTFSERDEVAVTLIDNAFLTVDVAAVMRFSAINGLMRQTRGRYAETFT
jgi:hypothetical protein